jgi:hypothetical protein
VKLTLNLGSNKIQTIWDQAKKTTIFSQLVITWLNILLLSIKSARTQTHLLTGNYQTAAKTTNPPLPSSKTVY